MSEPNVCPVEQNRICRAALDLDATSLRDTVAADLVDELVNGEDIPRAYVERVVVRTLQLAAREHVVRFAINNAAQVYTLNSD